MRSSWKLAALLAAVMAAPGFAADDKHVAPASNGPRIQIALLLDTSSSMDGLIDQAKTQLWKVVNRFATAKREGKRPTLEIALYQYGNQGLSSESGYIQQVVPLTTDLDKVSEKLFGLRTNGGDEYCGQVIGKATQELKWSKSKEDLKLIYIAGNEPFSQGPVNYRNAVKSAIEHGIVVNTIFCGSASEGVSTGWKDGAVLADGSFMSIDHNAAVAEVIAPQDKEIARLGGELNKTYIGYGAQAPAAAARQAAQDSNAMGASAGVASQRAVSKASAFYDNSGWDLVDATKKGKAKVEEMKEAELPAELKNLKPAERQAFVDAKAKEREEIQKKITTLNAERTRFVAAEAKKASESGKGDSLDSAMIKAAESQAAKNNFTF
ncbi:MAG: vWA domain-containing protein [Myxococcaceae bacterium]